MTPDGIDLTTGQPVSKPPAGEPPRNKGGRPKGAQSKTTTQRVEGELRGRLESTFDRLADTVQGRGDDELAAAFSEGGKAMAGGLVSLTRTVKPLRSPLIILLGLVEPLLAFGRVGRILAGRMILRRQQAAQEAAMAAEAASQPSYGDPVPVG